MQPRQPADASERMARVALALDGLSVGDALGEWFFHPAAAILLQERAVPEPFWFYTDDTEMALAIADVLGRCGHVDQEELAAGFGERYRRNPRRGYGATAHEILAAIGAGKSWRTAAPSAFHGEGSMGNGAAMRVAPVGAYFADDYAEAARQAALSAEVTHAHPEGIACAMAVAVAAAWAWRRGRDQEPAGTMFDRVLGLTPPGATRDGIERARAVSAESTIAAAVAELGNGRRVVAADTAPFALWSAARHLDDYQEAIWNTIAAGGDIDTNCAIVGGIVALNVGRAGIPRPWLEAREELR
jgi:ADP-ribosylglycohydrolase